MSRISAGDRPIPTNEPKLETQQTSETESTQKTDTAGRAPLQEEQVAKKETQPTTDKGQQYESRLGGMARQVELQSQFPVKSEPTLKGLPDRNPNLDPNVHLDEKIDVTKNLPDGKAINKGLEGLDWGPSKAKTGPGHFGVEMTYGGMKAPTDVLSEVLNGGKPAPNTSDPQHGGGIRSPKYDLISQEAQPDGTSLKDKVKDAAEKVKDTAEKVLDMIVDEAIGIVAPFVRAPEAVKEATGRPADFLDGAEAIGKGSKSRRAAEIVKEDMVDPNADAVEPTAEDIDRIVKVEAGAVKHGVNPDLGVGTPPIQKNFVEKDPNWQVIDKNPDFIEANADQPNLFRTAQPETRPELQGGPKPDGPPSGIGDPNSNPS